MVATAALLLTLHPVAAVVGVILLAHAWAIPELYANRGAKVVKPRARGRRRRGGDRAGPARRPRGARGARAARADRAGDGARARSACGSWGRPARCSCAGGACTAGACGCRTRRCRARDRIAHLLLALREDEQGFATVANHAFAGARWRVRQATARRPSGRRSTPRSDSTEWIVAPGEDSATGPCRCGRCWPQHTCHDLPDRLALHRRAPRAPPRPRPHRRPLRRRRPPLPARPPAARGPRGRARASGSRT